MNNLKLLIICLILFCAGSQVNAQITKIEYDKMWAANTIKYNGVTAAADIKKANDLITLMEKKYPKDAGVILNRGVYYYSFLNDDNKALTMFSKAIEARPGYVTAYLYRARVLAKKGVYEKAIGDLNVVLQKEPQNIGALTDRGGYYFAIKDYANALKDFQEVTAADPANPSGYNDAANTLKLLGRKDEAATIYTTALSRPSSDSAALLSFYGKYLVSEQKFADALIQFEKAIKISNNKLYADDYNMAGVAAYKTKNYLPAHNYLNEAIEINPENINYYDNKASVYLDQKDWNGIIKSSFAMLQIDPNHAKANMLMYIGYVKSGRSTTTGNYFKNRAEDLDKNGSTNNSLPDSLLFFVPKDAKTRTAYFSSPDYKNLYKKYFTDFTNMEPEDVHLIFGSDFSGTDGLFKYTLPANSSVTHEEKNGKLYFLSTLKTDVAKVYNENGFFDEKSDIRLRLKLKITKADSAALVGIYGVTTGSNQIYYYFLVNPITKKYFVGYNQAGKYGIFHTLNEPGSPLIPNLNEDMLLQVITKNQELAFTVNNKILVQMPLNMFTEINTQIASGIHTENILSAEIDEFYGSAPSTAMSSEALAALGWTNGQKQQQNTVQQKPRKFLGTMMIHVDAKTYRFANVFGIYGYDDYVNEQALFSMLVKKCNPTNTYSKYTWRRGVDPGSAMKGWDLRDYDHKGNYYTTGEAVY